MRGEKYMDTEETVAIFDLRENEKVTVDLLKNFGIEPFEIRAFKTAPLLANRPTVVNKLLSLEVVGIEQVAADMPEYRLTLHNLSMKNIEAVRVDLVAGQRQLSTGMPQGLEGRPLLLVGETAQVRIPMVVSSRKTAGAYVPVVSVQQQYVIESAVFTDGTSEGDTGSEIFSGAGFQGVKFGRRVEMQRALPLFAAALESTDAISGDGVSRFLSQLEELNVGVTDAELVELQQRFPTREAKVLREWVEFGMHFTRKEMLDQLVHFQHADRKDFRSWLLDNKERYSQWLARLEPEGASQH
jgi:hypothetical protein